MIKNPKFLYIFSKLAEMIYFSTDGICHYITRNNNSIIPELSTNQEEADTKLCLHTLHALAQLRMDM